MPLMPPPSMLRTVILSPKPEDLLRSLGQDFAMFVQPLVINVLE